MLYMRCRCEQLLSASRKRLEAARVCAFAARISTFASTTLKRLLATILCGAVMADGVATIQSIRPNGAPDQLAQTVQSSSTRGWTSSILAKKSASKTTAFYSPWRASSQRAPNWRKLLKRPGQFRRLILSFFGCCFAWNYIRITPHMMMIKTVCAEFCKQNHPNNIIHFYLILRPLFCITFLGELLNVLASHFVLLLLFFGRKCFVITLLFFYICHVISNWNNVKIVIVISIWNNVKHEK